MTQYLSDEALCFSPDGAISWRTFAADIAAFRHRVEPASHVCNMFANRYDFMVGLAAAMLNGQTTLLPSATASEAVGAVLAGAPKPLMLGDRVVDVDAVWRIADIGGSDNTGSVAGLTPALEQATGKVHVFTSGSTKQPVRHVKDWASLAGGAGLTAEILADVGFAPGSCAIIGTTPHQHMYGLEATIFAALACGYCTYTGTVFYPGDLERAIDAARHAGFAKCVLVSSPVHLKFLESVLMGTPEICAVISATAPLPDILAQRLEARGDLPVMEIFGCTETGSLAKRRTVATDEWQPLDAFQLAEHEGICIATATYLLDPVPLGDAMTLTQQGRFRLGGRLGDMVSVAGKRTNLAALNAILADVDELRDGVVVHIPATDGDRIVVVAVLDPASGVAEAVARDAIRREFRNHVDAVFLPKRIGFVAKLPRSPTGKIPANAIPALLKDAAIDV